MLQILIDNLIFGALDAQSGNGPSPLFFIVGGLITLAVIIFAAVMYARLDEARQKPSQQIINVPVSLTGPFLALGLVFCVFVAVVMLIR